TNSYRIVKGRRIPKVGAFAKLRAQLSMLRKASRLVFLRQRLNSANNEPHSEPEMTDLELNKLILNLAFKSGIKSINNPKLFVDESKDAMKEYLASLIKDVVTNYDESEAAAAQAALA
ncbi:UNVERIFIED_CONTAM: hypothetical protein HDU68_002278, partial [Siphonaria sp. JEL0065]